MEAKGKTFLKVTGILLIIEGVIGVISYGFMTLILGAGTLIAKPEGGASVMIIAALYTLSAIVSLIAGILGVKNASNKGAAGKCLVWGIINLALTFAAGVWSLSGEGFSFGHVLYTCVGFIIPSLYVAGAYLNE